MTHEDADIGGQVKRWRTALNMSQADLAEELTRAGHPMQQQTILKIEKGTRPLKFTEAAAIAKVFKSDVGDLLNYTEESEAAAFVSYTGYILSRLGLEAARHKAVFIKKHEQVVQLVQDLDPALHELVKGNALKYAVRTPDEILDGYMRVHALTEGSSTPERGPKRFNDSVDFEFLMEGNDG